MIRKPADADANGKSVSCHTAAGSYVNIDTAHTTKCFTNVPIYRDRHLPRRSLMKVISQAGLLETTKFQSLLNTYGS